MNRLIFLVTLILFAGYSILPAQNTCSDQLRQVQRNFDDGLLDDIPSLLADCMKEGFTKEEKTNAYKLLIQTYLFSEETQKADEVMIQFLSEFPSYKMAVNDPKEFINLYNTYRTKPIFRLEVMAGLSFCMPVVVQPYGISDLKSTGYQSRMGYHFEMSYINTLYQNFNYSLGASFTLMNYGQTSSPYDYSTVEAVFSDMYMGIPMAIRYNYSIGRINLFARAGIEPAFLVSSKVDLTRTDDILERSEPFTGTEDLIGAHNRFDLRPLISLGTKLNIGRDQLMISAGYKFSTSSQLNEAKRYSNLTLGDKYYFLEDELLLNQTFITLSYIRPVYKPKKIL